MVVGKEKWWIDIGYLGSRIRSQRSSSVSFVVTSPFAANAMRRNTVKPTEPFISGTDSWSTDDHYRAWHLPGKK